MVETCVARTLRAGHNPAASNLGQISEHMRGRRHYDGQRRGKPEQVKLLKELGASYVCDTSQRPFAPTSPTARSAGATVGRRDRRRKAGRIHIAVHGGRAERNAKSYSRYGSSPTAGHLRGMDTSYTSSGAVAWIGQAAVCPTVF